MSHRQMGVHHCTTEPWGLCWSSQSTDPTHRWTRVTWIHTCVVAVGPSSQTEPFLSAFRVSTCLNHFLYCPDATLDRILWRGQGSNQSLGFEGAGKGVVHGAFGCTRLEDQRDLKGVGDVSTLGLQVPPQKVFGPSKPTPNTFLEGTWSPRVRCI